MTPLALGLDYAHRVTPATLGCFRTKQASFICRYLAPVSFKKTLTAAEAAEIDAAGLNLVSVWETAAARALQGQGAGIADAITAKAVAQAAGQPTGTPIFFAVDCDVTKDADFQKVDAYLRGATSILAGTYPVGVYGSYAVVERMAEGGAALYFWQTSAWSHGQVSSRADIYQARNGVNWCGGNNDLDYALQEDFGQWTPGGGATHPLVAVPADVERSDGVTPDDVKALQKLLNGLGASPALAVDGICGDKTKAALASAKVPKADPWTAEKARDWDALAALVRTLMTS